MEVFYNLYAEKDMIAVVVQSEEKLLQEMPQLLTASSLARWAELFRFLILCPEFRFSDIFPEV